MGGAKFDESRWIIQIKRRIEEEEKELSISIFNVPKELLATKPEAYIPQAVSIGPYHHWRSELYEMERYKLAAARRAQKRINCRKFDSVAEEVHKHVLQIRSCYHKFLDYKGETLSWLMALDASFVLEYLQFYVSKDMGENMDAELKKMGAVFDPHGRTDSHNAIVRDLMMLENQIPIFLLQKLLEMQFESKDKAEEKLSMLVRKACVELSPFKFGLPENLKQRGHILEVLYYALVPISHEKDEMAEKNAPPSIDTQPVREALTALWRVFSSLKVGPVRRLVALARRVMNGRAVQFVMKLPWQLLSSLGKLPVFRAFKGPLTFVFRGGSNGKENIKDDEAGAAGEGGKTVVSPPLRDELHIPSVADLYNAGVKFAPSDGDLTSIRFDKKTVTLYLPAVRLDTNSEVILRNLVAFEASAAPGALVLTRYTDFMNGMIDTEEDVSLLRKSGIIYNHLKNDAEVASLWNGMGKCVRLTKAAFLDKVIADVNKYYNRKWNVAMADYVKKYVFGSWQFLSLMAAIILLLLTCLQAFCSVYDCKSWVGNAQVFRGS
eukprot:Gb_20970 [translate_table: standard]